MPQFLSLSYRFRCRCRISCAIIQRTICTLAIRTHHSKRRIYSSALRTYPAIVSKLELLSSINSQAPLDICPFFVFLKIIHITSPLKCSMSSSTVALCGKILLSSPSSIYDCIFLCILGSSHIIQSYPITSI